MIILSQKDPRWSSVLLGPGPLTIGQDGCLLTCLSMLSDYFGNYKDPVEMMKCVTIDSDDEILLNTLKTKGFVFQTKLDGRNDTEIAKSIKDPERAVILKLGLPHNKTHFVLATGTPLFGNTYKTVDPWLGARSTTAIWGNNIIGSKHFIKY